MTTCPSIIAEEVSVTSLTFHKMVRFHFVVTMFVTRWTCTIRQNVGAHCPVILIYHTYHYEHQSGCYRPMYRRHDKKMSQNGRFSLLGVPEYFPISTFHGSKCWRRPFGHFDTPLQLFRNFTIVPGPGEGFGITVHHIRRTRKLAS